MSEWITVTLSIKVPDAEYFHQLKERNYPEADKLMQRCASVVEAEFLQQFKSGVN